MTESAATNFERTLDFFILSGFRDGPRSLLEVQHRVQWAEQLLQVAAAKKGRPTFSSLSTALERLEGEDWVKCKRSGERRPAESFYSPTEAGQHWLEQERARGTQSFLSLLRTVNLKGRFEDFWTNPAHSGRTSSLPGEAIERSSNGTLLRLAKLLTHCSPKSSQSIRDSWQQIQGVLASAR